MITADELDRIVPLARSRLPIIVEPLNYAMRTYGISDTPIREAMFIAQVAHESGSFRYTKEIASGAEYDLGKKAISLGNTPEDDGDGERYKGRGFIQITGRNNYKACGEALGLDLIAHPEYLELPTAACQSAAWFWYVNGLNELSDKNDFLAITKRINGGTNGWKERQQFFEMAKRVLSQN